MASLRDIRKRIKSVKSTQKITRAMKLVSAAKLKRSQSAITSARPYAVSLHDLISRIAARSGMDEQVHPLLDKRPQPKRVMLVVLTSDRGMCGAFNSNSIRRAERFLLDNKNLEVVEIGTIGRRGRDHFRKKKGVTIRREYVHVLDNPNFKNAQRIAEEISEEFIKRDLDAVYFVYSEFKSALTQKLVVEQMLPIQASTEVKNAALEFKYEPTQAVVLDSLLPRYLATQVYRAILESVASEHGARMNAMENATKNASDMIDRLTLTYNRARQAAITRELMEIISGAEAQKG